MNRLADTIRAIRKARGLNQSEFAEVVGATQSTVTRWETGSVPGGEYLHKIAGFANITVEQLMGTDEWASGGDNNILVVGYVGAGAEIIPFDDFAKGNGFDHVARPPFVRGRAVAVEVRGDSLLPVAENGWRLIYSGDQTLDESAVLNRLCVVRLTDDRVLVKRVMRGGVPGRYHLVSTNAPMIEDAALVWAARVIAIVPD